MNPNKNNENEVNKSVDYGEFARKILEKMFDAEDAEKRKFVKELFDKYKEFEESKDGKYTQDWPAYNNASQKEKIILMRILDELLDYTDFPTTTKTGRKPGSIRDKIFYLVLQAYNIKSSRRCISDLELARRSGFIEKHRTSILS